MDQHLHGRETLLAEFSAADCMFGFNIEALFRFLPRADHPALAAYCDRMRARPAYLRAAARAGGDAIYARDFYELPDG
jgi:glutathione S-transferase